MVTKCEQKVSYLKEDIIGGRYVYQLVCQFASALPIFYSRTGINKYTPQLQSCGFTYTKVLYIASKTPSKIILFP